MTTSYMETETAQDREDAVEQNKVFFTLTMDSAAEIGSLTPMTVQTSELSDPAGIIPIGTEAATF